MYQPIYKYSALLCHNDPPRVSNDDLGKYNFKGNKTFTTMVQYWCPLPGWGYPSNGETNVTSICQADQAWSVTEVEDCVCKKKAEERSSSPCI